MPPNELVSVIMPVYKVEKYVGEAIRSVLDQSHPNLELIIVDDHSPDGSHAVVASFTDPRLRTIRLERNRGVAFARNTAMAQARGDYLVLMDSDDVMRPTRLERQLAFMRRHPDVALSGGLSGTIGIDGERKPDPGNVAIDSRAANASLVFTNVFCTSTVMMRREAVPEGGFRQQYAEDYDFLVRVGAAHRLGMAREVYVDYRIRPDSAMRTYALDSKKKDIWASQQPLFEALGIVPTPKERETHLLGRVHCGNLSAEELRAIFDWYGRLVRANREAGAYPEREFNMAASYVWFEQLFRATGCGLSALRLFLRSPLSFAHRQPWPMRAKFVAKALLRREFDRQERESGYAREA